MLELNQVYNFTTHAPAQLGASYQLMRVVSIMNLTEAIKYRDIISVHKSILPLLPDTIPTDPGLLRYYRFRDIISGNTVVLAHEWLVETSITLVESTNLSIKVFNVSTDDISTIGRALSELGYTNVVLDTF